jgi:hypothetical protein
MWYRVILAAVAMFLSAQYSWTAEPPCNAKPDPKALAGASRLIDSSTWQVCATSPVRFGTDMPNAVAILLRSTKPQGESGTGEPLFGVDLVIANDGKKVYRFTDFTDKWKFFIDDDLRVQNLAVHGANAVLFHSGEVGASDQWRALHVVFLPAGELFARDVAANDFGDSWRHKTRWVTIKGVPTVLVAKPIEPAGANDPHMCHSCPKFYQYFVYQWSPSRSSFIVNRVIQSERDVNAETDPLDADKSFIEEAIAKGSPSPAL